MTERRHDSGPVADPDIDVGDRGPELIVADIERKDFVKYAGASGDFNPIHYDEPYAKDAGNPTVFGQGMLTAGFVATMAVDWFGIDAITAFSTRFMSRIFPGDTITVSGEVVSVERGEEWSTVVADLEAVTDEGETAVTGSVTARLPFGDQ